MSDVLVYLLNFVVLVCVVNQNQQKIKGTSCYKTDNINEEEKGY